MCDFSMPENNEVAARKTSYHIVGSQNLISKIDTTWRLSEDLENASMEIDEWRNISTVVMPFDVSVSVGLKPAGED